MNLVVDSQWAADWMIPKTSWFRLRWLRQHCSSPLCARSMQHWWEKRHMYKSIIIQIILVRISCENPDPRPSEGFPTLERMSHIWRAAGESEGTRSRWWRAWSLGKIQARRRGDPMVQRASTGEPVRTSGTDVGTLRDATWVNCNWKKII